MKGQPGPGRGKQQKDTTGPQTVVVVDDSSTMRTVIQKELEAAGFDVVAFNDGLEALSSLRWMQRLPDLILLDIDMPRMDGFACCEQLRAMEAQGLFEEAEEARIPVLFVSANDTFDNRSRGFHLGSLEFISKPFARGDIAAAVSKVLRPQTTFAGMVALVIDDERSLRRMVRTCLEQIGLRVLEAEDGRQAFELIKEGRAEVDLAIVDFDMPVMRGDEFIHLTRQCPETGHLPMISLSAAGAPQTILRMFRAGATDYLVKPFIAEELLARVQVHLNLRRYMCHLEEMNRNLYDKAVNDALTGLRNKRYFQEAFEELFARAQRSQGDLSCLFFDLDHFKRVNDTCGHGFGDYVLKTIGALVKANVRRGDLAARFGGEEFVIALPNTGLAPARFVAEKIRTLVETHRFRDQGRQWAVTVSVGVASLHGHRPASATTLLQLADQALYLAKGAGRNRVVCCPD
ncbi:diguanylate cyclase [Desulfobulbus elongatus]|uniref:diguanylate cyclase n=1 Tax=Desulfobulbus elongatus TaxID=53332 RepID=UPI0009FBC4A9|nr:diguanylate cyclase [Desulfobulbus elongatus]